jgi:hypothetical protein
VITTIRGEIASLLAKLSKAVRTPGADGAKLTEALQVDPTANTPGHAVLNLKSGASCPDRLIAEIDKGTPPVFVSVKLWGALEDPIVWPEKLILETFRLACAGRTPAPAKVTIWGELATESLKIRVAERTPTALGTKVTATVQLAWTVRTAPQVVAIVKSAAFVPAIQMPLKPRGAVPELVTITGGRVLETPTT